MFVATHFLETLNQTRGMCDGGPTAGVCNCTDADCCVAGQSTFTGIKTGRCGSAGNCEVSSWCPLENKAAAANVWLENIENWSILLRVSAYFPKYSFRKTNTDVGELVNGYNSFTVGDVLQKVGYSYGEIQENGCLIVADVHYQCDLDDSSPHCVPQYTFTRLDDPNPDSFTTGFNFRYHELQGGGLSGNGGSTTSRNLYKMFGIRIIFQVTGEARKFSVLALTTTLGSGVALLGISSLIADYVMMYILPEKKVYADHKFHDVDRSSFISSENTVSKQEIKAEVV